MATLTAQFTYADGDQVAVKVEIENDYPDTLSQAVRTCTDALRKAMVCGLVVQAEDDDEG